MSVQNRRTLIKKRSATIDLAEQVGKWKDIPNVLGVGVAVIYVVGFFISSLQFAHYGVSDFNLFRARYIAVGVMFAFTTAIAILQCLSVTAIRNVASKADRSRMFLALAPLAGWLIFAFLWCELIFFLCGKPMITVEFGLASLASVMYMIVISIFCVLWRWCLHSTSNFKDVPQVSLIFQFVICCFCVMFYSGVLFPLLPAGLGGGRLTRVVVVASSDGVASLGALIPMDSKLPVNSLPINLADEDDKSLIVVVHDGYNHGIWPFTTSRDLYGHAVRIDRSLLKGVRYLDQARVF